MKNNKHFQKNTDYKEFFDLIEYTFVSINLLEEALTHPSARKTIKRSSKKNLSTEEKIENMNSEKLSNRPFNYQRLEFLGDRVLGFVIGNEIFNQFPDDSEGEISKRFSNIVSGEICAKIGKSLNLGKYIILSNGEENYGGRENSSNIEDVMESLIGAIFLDGGINIAANFILNLWDKYIKSGESSSTDVKSLVQQWSQAEYGVLPVYEVESKTGPDHSLSFVVSVCIPGKTEKFTGEGSSKKEAEKNAAKEMYKNFISKK